MLISCIIEGMEIDEAINCAISFAKDMDGYCECVETVEKAVKLSKDDLVDTDAIRMLGEGGLQRGISYSIFIVV